MPEFRKPNKNGPDKAVGGADRNTGAYMCVDQDLCVGCAACQAECPSGAVSMIEDRASINPGRCTACGACRDVCPMAAIHAV